MQPEQLRQRISENLERVRGQIDACAGGRRIRLVCVTKYARLEWVEALLEGGAEELGENLLPNAAERFAALKDSGFIFTAHLIGAQQSRKLRLIPGSFDMYQALDSREDADELQRRLSEGQSLDVLLQVNVGNEQQKRGALPEQLDELLAHISTYCPGLGLRGLMAIPPGPQAYADAASFAAGSRRHFAAMRELFDRINRLNRPGVGVPAWDTLSMGMSQDFELAIAEGANMVRLGSALFEGLEG